MKNINLNSLLAFLMFVSPMVWASNETNTAPAPSATQESKKPQDQGSASTEVEVLDSTQKIRFDKHQLNEFIDLFSKKHGWASQDVQTILASVSPDASINAQYALAKNKPSKNWLAYRNRYLGVSRVNEAKRFAKENQATLSRAQKQFGVPSTILTAILAVESRFGQEKGHDRALSVLVNLAFARDIDVPISDTVKARMDSYQSELAHFLLLNQAKRLGKQGQNIKSSYAGAMGIPQFFPSQVRKYAIDFNGDGKVDPLNNSSDAIGSLANYLHQQGWQNRRPVLWRITQDASNREILKGLVKKSAKPTIKITDLLAKGLLLDTPVNEAKEKNTLVAVIDLPSPGKVTQYRLGLQNFYVLTRYGHSFFYAQVVDELAKEIAP